MNKKYLNKLLLFDKPPKEWVKYKNDYMNEIKSKLTKILNDFDYIDNVIDKELAGSNKFTVKNIRNIQKVMDKHFEKELKNNTK